MNRKTSKFTAVRIYCLFLSLLGTTFSFGQTTIGGILATSTLTEAGSPYHVTANLLIPTGVTVTIEPGVTLEFNNNISLFVQGSLQAIGTVTDSIFFKPHASAGSGWGAIKWDEATDYNEISLAGNILSYVSYYGTSPIPPYLWIEGCKVRIQNSRFHDCPKQFTCRGNAQIYNNLFHNMDAVALVVGSSIWDAEADVIGNEFYNINDDYAAIFINAGNFVDNYIHDIHGSARVLQVGNSCFIANNLIENCSGAAIYTSDYYEDAEIYCNTLRNNVVNLYIKCKSNAIITNNNFLDPIDYNVVLRGGSGPDPYLGHQLGSCSGIADIGSFDYFDLQGNYWGGLSPSELEESFFDVEDDFYVRQKVDYSDAAIDTDCSMRIVSVSEIDQLEFKIFPNPTNSILNLEIEAEIQSLEIYDQFGRLIIVHTDGSKVLDVGDLPVGIYYIRMLSEGNIGNAKFVKN